MSRCAKWTLALVIVVMGVGFVGAMLAPLFVALGPPRAAVAPIEASPSHWHAHTATLGSGYAAVGIVVAVAMAVGGISRLVDWARRPRRRGPSN